MLSVIVLDSTRTGPSPLHGPCVYVFATYAGFNTQLGADTRGSLHLDPDGSFPNHLANPEVIEPSLLPSAITYSLRHIENKYSTRCSVGGCVGPDVFLECAGSDVVLCYMPRKCKEVRNANLPYY